MDEEGYKIELSHLILPAPNGRRYEVLLDELYSLNFIPKIARDENRASDGLYLREMYSCELDRPCSVLEMMIALAGRFDGNSGFDPDQARFNFWVLIENMTLDRFDDRHIGTGIQSGYGRLTIENIIERFMDRKYQFDGFGGLFPLKNPKKDQRNVEIWDQMQEWEIENYGV